MAERNNVVYDESGRARFFKIDRSAPADPVEALARGADVGLAGASPQQSARNFLFANAATLGIGPEEVAGLETNAAVAPAPEGQALRFESEKPMMDTTTVTYVQTMFGLPIHEAGISVTTQGPGNEVAAASSTLHYDIKAPAPGAGLVPLTAEGTDASNGAYDDLLRNALGPAGAKARINRTTLMVYRYDAARRLETHPHDKDDSGFCGGVPKLPVEPVPESIEDGTHYIVVDALFTLKDEKGMSMNWRAFVEVDSGSLLYLRALVDCATAQVFDRDPITKSGLAAHLPSATAATLDAVRDVVSLSNLSPVVGGSQALSGTYVRLFENSAPNVPPPTRVSPFNFDYGSRTNDFAAANAYYHCNRFFQLVGDLGFSIASYFDGTAFPVPVDHRGLGNVVNANCPGDAFGDGIGQVNFALAHTGDTVNPISIGADWRVVIHEIGGHGILWDHVNSPNFGFAHSAGDGIAAILNDPGSAAPDRFLTFPWVSIGRRHDRPVNGWGWGGANDVGGYSSEQILATTHFRIYRSLGGDAGTLASKELAARTTVYLILRAVGQLTPATNPPTPLAWEGQLETADLGTWNPVNPPGSFAGGAYHKVIRWAFEKQGLFRAPGAPATVEGVAPAVDVFIDDGRHGEYQYQPNHWSCTDIWNRTSTGAGGGVHQDPIVGQTNYAYVRVKNRGTQTAANVVVKGFHALPGAGLVFPADWAPMTTPQLAAPNIAAGDLTGVVVGPFQWSPSQVGHECMFFSVSATGDAGNIDGRVVGPIGEWRLVPHDNNLGQRNVCPVEPELQKGVLHFNWDRLPFWIRNRDRKAVRTTFEVKLPGWLAKLGWGFGVAQAARGKLVIEPGAVLKVTLAQSKKGKPITAELLAGQKDRSVIVSVFQDGIGVGGMTFQLTPPRQTQPKRPLTRS